MKTLKIISTVMCLAILMGCQTPPSEDIEFSMYFDKTGSNDHNKIDITTYDILEIFDLKNNPFNHGKVRISTLTETHLSKVEIVKLSAITSMSEYQKYVREAEINKFVAGIDSLLTAFRNMESGKQASSLFIPINKELTRLARSNATQKYLCLYSDLFENSSSLFSAYSEKEFEKLLENPEKLTELLSSKAPLPEDLSGIKVFIIYNPDLDTDHQFLSISQWYKNLLESKNAEVSIGANLIFN